MKYVLTGTDRGVALRIVGIYAAVAAVWIYASDQIMGWLVRDPAILVEIGILKGFLFILVTGTLLYLLIARHLRQAGEIREELRRSRDLLQTFSEGTTDAIYVKDRQGKYLLFNSAAARITGKGAAEVLGCDDTLLFPTEEARTLMEKDRQVMDGGRVMTYEEHLTVGDGSKRTFLATKGPILSVTGETGGLFGIARDITELKQQECALREKSIEMERFAYMISHDLKSPLITVRTFLGYLEKDLEITTAARVETDLHHMRRATDKMQRLLDELLEMSRIGRVSNPPEPCPFRALVDEALQAVAGSTAARGVVLTVSDEPLTLVGDRPRLVEIWQNLLENAVKFMGEQPAPRLEIGTERRGGERVFYVCDNGRGIEPEDQEKIFGLFVRLDARQEGTGLGLALAKRIVELYRGRIWVESGGSGCGSRFCFTLPDACEEQRGGEPA